MSHDSVNLHQNVIGALHPLIDRILKLHFRYSLYLVGSCATGTASSASDIDLLAIVDNQEIDLLIKDLRKILKKKLVYLRNKIDFKVLSWEEYQKKKINNHLFLYSMLSMGKHICGEFLTIKFSRDFIMKLINKTTDNLSLANDSIIECKNYTLISSILFSSTKTLSILHQIINESTEISLKDVLGRNLVPLAREYEKITQKGIIKGLGDNQRYKTQHSGNYKRLQEAYTQVLTYSKTVITYFGELPQVTS